MQNKGKIKVKVWSESDGLRILNIHSDPPFSICTICDAAVREFIDKCATLKCVSNRPGARNCTNPSLKWLKLAVHIGKLKSKCIYDIRWASGCFTP